MRRERKKHEKGGEKLRHGKLCPPEEKGVRPQTLDEKPAKAVQAEIEEEDLPLKELLSGAAPEKKKEEDGEIPSALIEKGRMDLNIADAVHEDLPIQYGAGQHILIYDILPEAHRKERIRISPEGLCVEEIPPASDRLSEDQADDAAVRHIQETELPPPRKEKAAEDRGQNAAVDRKSPVAGHENLRGMLRIIAPLKDHIVGPRAEDRKHDGVKREILNIVRLPSPVLIIPGGDQYADQHPDGDDDPVKGDSKAEGRNRIHEMADADAKMRKIYVV